MSVLYGVWQAQNFCAKSGASYARRPFDSVWKMRVLRRQETALHVGGKCVQAGNNSSKEA